MSSDGQALFERCALFLRSNLEFDLATPYPEPPQPGRAQFRAAASLVLLLGVVLPFVWWGFAVNTACVIMLWGLLWAWLYHFGEHAFCRPPEGWSLGVVYWPFASQAEYERVCAASVPGVWRQ